MARVVHPSEQMMIVDMMLSMDSSGNYIYTQRDMERETGKSRQYIRKLAKIVGHQFPRNGIELVGKICVCTNCGVFFRRSASKVDKVKNQFCDNYCRESWTKGVNHPGYKTGKTFATFSQWIKNQSGYKKFREAVLERDGNRCVVTGKIEELDVHHIYFKNEMSNPEKALDVSNGITLSKEAHRRIHEIIREGADFEDAVELLKREYKQNVGQEKKQ